jgi:di/tricarboxylate transporter
LMTIPHFFLIIVVVIPLLLVVLGRIRIDVASIFIAVSFGSAQYLGMGILGPAFTPNDAIKALSGVNQPVILTLVGLFIITASLEKSGITRWMARNMLKIGGSSERKLIALFAGTTALFSLIINNLAAGALVLPIAMDVARRTGIKPSKLLIPVAYGSLLGGAATYFTTANMIVSNLLTTTDPPQAPLHILAFTPTGGLMAVAGIAFLSLFGHRWLPDRESRLEKMMARLTGSDLEDYYRLGERLWEARVVPGSPFANRALSESRIGERFGLVVAGMWHKQQEIFAPSPDQFIHSGDILLIVGREDRVNALAESGLKVKPKNFAKHISKRGVSFIEVMPSPHSRAIGRTLRDLDFRVRYRATALALFRGGQSYRTDLGGFPLQLGDSLLIIGSRKSMDRLRNNPDFIVLESDDSDQPLEKAPAFLAIGVLFSAITASVLGMPIYLAMLGGALILILAKVLEMEEAYRAIEWQVVVLIAGMYTVSLAMVNTGLAGIIGELMVTLLAPFGPLGLAVGAYVLTLLLTQIMGGQVTILVTGPIAISAAISLDIDPHAVAVASAMGCSSSFFLPIAHPVNILMISPANYQFRDFFKIGWRLTLVCFLALIAGMMLFW